MHEQNNGTYSTMPNTLPPFDKGTRETAEELKQKTSQTVDQAKQQTGELVAEAKSKVEEMAGEVKHQAGAAIDDVKRQAADAANERKVDVSERLHVVASALRDSGQQFEQHQESKFAEYVKTAADQVDQFAGYLETRDVGEIWQGVNVMARRQPELFIVGSLAAGFFLGRFLKSTQSRSPQDTDDSYGSAIGRDYSKVTTWAAGSSEGGTSHDAMRSLGADDFNGQRSIKNRSASETVPGLGPDWNIGKERSEPFDPERTDPSTKEELSW